MPAKSKAQQRFMGMVHAAQKGELDNPSSKVEKAADSMSDADAKDYASTKHKGLPNHVKKENMEKELKEIIRQTYRDSLRESINEAKNTQPKNDWGKRLVEAIYNNVSAIDSLVNKDKRDVKDIMSNFGNPLINSIKETIKYNYKPHPIAGGHFNAKRKDNKYSEETYNKETIKQFKLQLAGLLKIAEFLNTKPSKAAVKKLVDMWRDIWNFRGGAEIALSGDMYNSIYESVNEDATELPQATIPSAVKVKLQMAIDKIKDSKLSNNAKLQLVAQVIDALDVDKSQLSNIANKIRSKMESVNEGYPTDLKVGSVIMGQGFTMLKGIEGGKYYKVVEMDDYSATLVPSDKSGNVKGSKKVRHKLDSIEGGIKTAKRGDENGIVVESVNESISHEAMGIASMTNTRKEAVQKFIDDNNLNAKEILTHVTKGKLPERIRFVQALVGTPNNSSFKWYVKTYANESVVTEGTNEEWAGLDTIKRGGYGSSRLQNGDKIRMVIDARKNKYYNGVINGSSIKWEDGAKSELSLSTQASNRGDLQVLRPTTKNESVNEGKKAFKINPPIGKAKYSISAHNGVSKHKDGSDFWDILIFKNKADLERRAKYFRGEKYIEEAVVTEGRYDADLDKIEAVVKNATSFMNVGSELKKAGIKYDFTTSMIPMYMIKVSGNTIAICNKKYAAGAEREVKDIAIGLLN